MRQPRPPPLALSLDAPFSAAISFPLPSISLSASSFHTVASATYAIHQGGAPAPDPWPLPSPVAVSLEIRPSRALADACEQLLLRWSLQVSSRPKIPRSSPKGVRRWHRPFPAPGLLQPPPASSLLHLRPSPSSVGLLARCSCPSSRLCLLHDASHARCCKLCLTSITSMTVPLRCSAKTT
ncbi:uncharacterized protein [Triticum aestivum]|uniref:uncharacterized protein n=1 Tax=Triticum aestivum TaxID=4565 RepID=UPI001D009492|nr:uncharacterized protein LOC123129583 [Triticum aestivum]